jgi:hypothetical protein
VWSSIISTVLRYKSLVLLRKEKTFCLNSTLTKKRQIKIKWQIADRYHFLYLQTFEIKPQICGCKEGWAI